MKAVVLSCPRCGTSFAHAMSEGLDARCESCAAEFRVDEVEEVPRFILRLLELEDERRRKSAEKVAPGAEKAVPGAEKVAAAPEAEKAAPGVEKASPGAARPAAEPPPAANVPFKLPMLTPEAEDGPVASDLVVPVSSRPGSGAVADTGAQAAVSGSTAAARAASTARPAAEAPAGGSPPAAPPTGAASPSVVPAESVRIRAPSAFGRASGAADDEGAREPAARPAAPSSAATATPDAEDAMRVEAFVPSEAASGKVATAATGQSDKVRAPAAAGRQPAKAPAYAAARSGKAAATSLGRPKAPASAAARSGPATREPSGKVAGPARREPSGKAAPAAGPKEPDALPPPPVPLQAGPELEELPSAPVPPPTREDSFVGALLGFGRGSAAESARAGRRPSAQAEGEAPTMPGVLPAKLDDGASFEVVVQEPVAPRAAAGKASAARGAAPAAGTFDLEMPADASTAPPTAGDASAAPAGDASTAPAGDASTAPAATQGEEVDTAAVPTPEVTGLVRARGGARRRTRLVALVAAGGAVALAAVITVVIVGVGHRTSVPAPEVPKPSPPPAPVAAVEPPASAPAVESSRRTSGTARAAAVPASAPEPDAGVPGLVRARRRRVPVVVDYDVPSPTTPKKPRPHRERPQPAQPGTDTHEPDLEAARDAYAQANQHYWFGRFGEAERLYRKSIAEYPGYAAGYRGLGLTYARRGEKARAIDAYTRYLRMAPKARDAAIIRTRLEQLR